jgi:hypothetical protein
MALYPRRYNSSRGSNFETRTYEETCPTQKNRHKSAIVEDQHAVQITDFPGFIFVLFSLKRVQELRELSR